MYLYEKNQSCFDDAAMKGERRIEDVMGIHDDLRL